MAGGFPEIKNQCLFLGVWLGSVDGLNIGPNEDSVLVKSLGAIDGILLGKYDAIEQKQS